MNKALLRRQLEDPTFVDTHTKEEIEALKALLRELDFKVGVEVG